jgi:Undecaprenyl-phosphate galactose phosphotransferase WbaP
MSTLLVDPEPQISPTTSGIRANSPLRKSPRFHPVLCVLALLFCDLLTIGCALKIALMICAYWTRLQGSGSLNGAYTLAHYRESVWLWILLVGCLAAEGLYTQRRSLWSEIGALLKAIGGGLSSMLAAVALTQNSAGVSRMAILLTAAFLFVLLPLGRFWIKRVLGKLGLWAKSILILGASETARLALRGLEADAVLGYEVAGMLDENAANRGNFAGMFLGKPLQVLGNIDEAREWMEKTGTRDLLIALPELPEERLLAIVEGLQPHCGNIYVVPRMWGLPLMNLHVEGFLRERVMMLKLSNHQEKPWNRWMKRGSDLLLGSILTLLVLPVALAIVVCIKLESAGPSLFVQRRLGTRGGTFRCLKFRTMVADADEKLAAHLAANPLAAEEWARYAKLRDYDPRLTRIGAFLRRWSLDELPQFWNVLRGEMSLVGPRPYLPRECERIGAKLSIILSVRPGVTGLWQVSGRNRLTFDERVHLEAWYVRNWTVWLDCILLGKTIHTVLYPDGGLSARQQQAPATSGPAPSKPAEMYFSAGK